MSETSGKVFVVTGATSGIGKAVALGMAKAGYTLAVLGRRKDALEAVAEETGAGFSAVCDVTDPDQVKAFFSFVRTRLGRIDIVFNNAGRSAMPANFGDTDIADWNDVIDTNLNGAFYVAREAFRTMRDQDPRGGRIINNGSISAHVPRPESAAYAASKHAITGLTRAIALDGRAHDIACSQIDIGNTATDMTAKMSAGSLQANGTIASEPTFDVRHVVDAVGYMAGLPLDANVQFMTVMATNMPYIGRG